VSSPREYQVFQRKGRMEGVAARLQGHAVLDCDAVRVRVLGKPLEGAMDSNWRKTDLDPVNKEFFLDVPLPAGGWYRWEVQALRGSEVYATQVVDHVGVGEVFIVIGQSNSANYGSEKQKTVTGMVSSFDGTKWGLANDPQPGAGGDRGSFMPTFGDAIYDKYHVPIGIVAAGAGGTSVREWLPEGERMKQQPTTGENVRLVAPGEWESTGKLFKALIRRIESLGPRGFRAVLWHQGESDASQVRWGCPADRQITGKQYTEFMEKLINATRARAGWAVPWITAQATYHSEQDTGDAEFRAAQKSLWEKGIALEGPDTDSLEAKFRNGVHFNGKGLQAHGKMWAEKVGIYLDKVLEQSNR